MRIRRSVGGAKEVPVIGLDLSLKRPAAVCIPAGWKIGDWDELDWWAGDEVPGVDDHGDDVGRCKRLIWISDQVLNFVINRNVSHHVFAEDYAFSQSGPTARKLAENAGVTRVELYRYGRVMRTVVAASARKLLLGKCPQQDQKLIVQAALYRAGAPVSEKIVRKYVPEYRAPKIGGHPRPGRGLWGEDECDAFVVANWGRSEIGLTGLSLA